MNLRPPAQRAAACDFERLLFETNEALLALERHFIARFRQFKKIPADPSFYETDVAAFCILSHAEFERAFEDLCYSVVNACLIDYQTVGAISRPLVTLIACYPPAPRELGLEQRTLSSAKNLRGDLQSAKGRYWEFLSKNNGLGKLLEFCRPAGLEVDLTLIELGALNKLREFRGDRAHGVGVYTPLDPDDARTTVNEIGKLFRRCLGSGLWLARRSTLLVPWRDL